MTRERLNDSLWWLAAGPAIWFAHFLLSYVIAAVLCAKSGAPIPVVRGAIAIATALALSAIVAIGWRGWRRHCLGGTRSHTEDTAEDRHRFLGYTTLLLCGLSLVAVIYVALVPVFIGDCR